jgi:hypothetical protein
MVRSVREPIQVYLTPAERDVLDRCAAELGVSRSEVLRRGLRAIGDPAGASPGGGTSDEWLTPASLAPGAPPPSLPVAPLERLLDELQQDRGGR